MLGIGEAGDRQAVDRERGRPDARDPGQAGQDLSVGQRQKGLDLVLEGVDVARSSR